MRISDWSSDVCSSDLIAGLQLAVADFLLFEDKFVGASQIPAPAVERTDDATAVEMAGTFGQRRDAMRAEVVVRLDRRGGEPPPPDRMIPELVEAVVAGLGERDEVRVTRATVAPDIPEPELS